MKAQQSIEFLTVVSIVLVLIILIVFFLSQQATYLQQGVDKTVLNVIADNVESEFQGIVLAPTGVTRNITIPTFGGNVTIRNGYDLILNSSQQENHVRFMPYFINGWLDQGRNTISAQNGILMSCADCDKSELRVTFPQQTMCHNRSFAWRECSSIDGLNNTITGITANCTTSTAYAELNVTDTGTPIVQTNTTRNVTTWFVFDNVFNIPNNSGDFLEFSVDCYDDSDSLLIRRFFG